ncbi:MAG: hypothetical protein LBL38_01575, partial [Lactobacillales bacterium]|nr:hypothetical protein [Lactobacillales bacterium]
YIARFAIPEVKTAEQFKKYVRNQLHEHKKYSARQEAIKEISQWLIEHTKLSYIPKSLLDEEIKRLNSDIDKKALEAKIDKNKYITTHLGYQNLKEFEKVLNESAIKNLQLVIGIEKIIDELKIDISEKETEEHLTKMAKIYGMTLDMLKQRFNNNYDGIKTVLIQEKVFDELIKINK